MLVWSCGEVVNAVRRNCEGEAAGGEGPLCTPEEAADLNLADTIQGMPYSSLCPKTFIFFT